MRFFGQVATVPVLVGPRARAHSKRPCSDVQALPLSGPADAGTLGEFDVSLNTSC
jgi:hypothetical protein